MPKSIATAVAPQTVVPVAITFNQLHLLHQQISVVTDELMKGYEHSSATKIAIFVRNFDKSLNELEPKLNTPASKVCFNNLQSVIIDIKADIKKPVFYSDRLLTLAMLAERHLFSIVACLVPAFNVEGE